MIPAFKLPGHTKLFKMKVSTAAKEGAKRKQRIKVKQKSKQTPQRAPVVAINWLLKHLRELGDFRNELQWQWI
jgi:phosphopantetheine adenylyltransferase